MAVLLYRQRLSSIQHRRYGSPDDRDCQDRKASTRDCSSPEQAKNDVSAAPGGGLERPSAERESKWIGQTGRTTPPRLDVLESELFWPSLNLILKWVGWRKIAITFID